MAISAMNSVKMMECLHEGVRGLVEVVKSWTETGEMEHEG